MLFLYFSKQLSLIFFYIEFYIITEDIVRNQAKVCMNLIEATLSKLSNIQFYLQRLAPALYKEPLEILSFASIGEHTRHILEFYQCLLSQCSKGTINYDLRVRDTAIQQDPEIAAKVLSGIVELLPNSDIKRQLRLEICYDESQRVTNMVNTSFERELVYNLEHVIHHMAIIKIGLSVVAPGISLPEGFGVAPSTIRFKRNACVQ